MSLFFLVVSLLGVFAEDDRYIIALKKNETTIAEARIALEGLGVRVVKESSLLSFIAGTFRPELLGQIQHLSFVEYVEEDARRYPLPIHRPRHSRNLNASSGSDPLDTTEVVPYGISYVQGDVNAPGPSIGEVPVCIIDSGLDVDHVEFGALKTAGLVQGYPTGWDTDYCSHGTHVAGTITAQRNGQGVIGVLHDPLLPLIIVKVFGDNCVWSYASDLADAGAQCTSRGAKVVSMSLGGSRAVLTEQLWFNTEYNKGFTLFVAAAGNSGTSAYSYPASYDGVVSVAAIDSTLTKASFSQFNNQVEISAPGVGVLSSVQTGSGEFVNFWIGGNAANSLQAYATAGDSPVYDPPKSSVQAPLCDCGLATAVCDCAGSICLISRGTNPFAEKVVNCQNGKGVGAVIYNNVAGTIIASLGSTVTTIPSATITQADGAAALATIGQTASLTIAQSNWEYYDGTSMATPHVSAVAALAWSYNPKCTNAQVRTLLQTTSQPLPTPTSPRSNEYGFGLVQASTAIKAISTLAC